MAGTRAMVRSLSVGAVAIMLALGAGVVPASAATFDWGPVVRVQGHVTDKTGAPIAGIRVQSDCGCDAGPTVATHLLGKDTTNANGYYSFDVRKRVALNIGFNDPHNDWVSSGRQKGQTEKRGSGYVIDAELERSGLLAGSVHDTSGAPIDSPQINIYEAASGREVEGADGTDRSGTWSVHLAPGDYKLLFFGGAYFTNAWYGGSSKATSTAVHVDGGGRLEHLDFVTSVIPSVNGTLTFDGNPAVVGPHSYDGPKERATVTLLDASGTRVARRVTAQGFSLDGIAPGDYTVDVRPLVDGPQWFVPKSVPVTVVARAAVRGLVIDLATVPASKSDKRSVGLSLVQRTKGIPKVGKIFRAKIVASSYGSVRGAKVTIFVNGEKVQTKVLPQSGRANFSIRPKRVEVGQFTISVTYSGTDTTRSRSHVYVYGLGGD